MNDLDLGEQEPIYLVEEATRSAKLASMVITSLTLVIGFAAGFIVCSTLSG